MKKVLIILLIVTLYSNIGWIVGSYYYNNISYNTSQNLTTLEKIAAGPKAIFTPSSTNSPEPIFVVLFFGILWPIGLAMVAAGWIGCFAYYAGWCIYYTGWFIFCGAAKLLGLA